MNEPIEEISYKGYTIQVWYDDLVGSPRKEWDNVGTMVCWHSRYNLGDKQPREDLEEWLRDQLHDQNWQMQEWLQEKLDVKLTDDETFDDFIDECSMSELMATFKLYNVVLPLYLYDHSGITMSTHSFRDPWDSGQVGFIYVSHKKAKEEWGDQDYLNKAEKYLEGEVQSYDDYLTGSVYGYKILDLEGEELEDSTWGYYGDEARKEMVDECKGIIDRCISKTKNKEQSNQEVE
jgi:hypothetical protein